MEVFTYINFLAGPSETAQTGDDQLILFVLLLSLALIFGTLLYWLLKSKKLGQLVKKIVGVGLPSIFVLIAIPSIFASQSYAAGSSTSVDAVVDKDNCAVSISNGHIQNTTDEDMQLIVTNSDAVNTGLNIPGLQNANLKVYVDGKKVLDDNPFDGYDGNMDLDYELKPGQTAQFSSELTGIDKQTAQKLEGSGNAIQLRFKFYYSMVEEEYNPDQEAPVADYLYEAEYSKWNVDKTNFLCECMAKREEWYGPDSEEYKEYLREEWGCTDEQIELIIAIRKYIEGSNPYVGLCTSCRHNNLIGRNFDWAYDDLDEYIMRTKGSDGEYQSIGVASTFFPLWLQELVGIKSVLPMLTMDGINKWGVAININVVPSNFDDTIGTNPGKERLCAGVIPRFVLDNAKSANEAVELLKERDIFTISLSEFHFMISDSTETYIVETVHNQLVVLKQKKANGDAAMANFHVTNSEFYDDYEIYCGDPNNYGSDYSKGAMGIERYEKAIEGLNAVNSLDDMVAHMKPIYYEHVYKDGYDFWSDKNGMESVQSKHVFSYYDDYGSEADKWAAERRATFVHCKKTFDDIHARENEIGWRLKTDEFANGVCQTVHASCYDLSTKELVVNVQERDVSFHFSLTGGFREDKGSHKALKLYVNGDNVGLATSCGAEESKWSFANNTLTLESDAMYSITGEDASKVEITDTTKVGYSITIPKVEHATAVVVVEGSSSPAKARMGIRAVQKDSNITVTFTADDGYKFVESQTEVDPTKYIVTITKISQDIIFGKTQGYNLPTAIKA